jgi:hypothetical protein
MAPALAKEHRSRLQPVNFGASIRGHRAADKRAMPRGMSRVQGIRSIVFFQAHVLGADCAVQRGCDDVLELAGNREGARWKPGLCDPRSFSFGLSCRDFKSTSALGPIRPPPPIHRPRAHPKLTPSEH